MNMTFNLLNPAYNPSILLTRPNLPRSSTDLENYKINNNQNNTLNNLFYFKPFQLKRTLSNLLLIKPQRSNSIISSSSHQTSSHSGSNKLLNRHSNNTSLSSQSTFLQISSTIISRSDELSAQVLLQRALEDDLMARLSESNEISSLPNSEVQNSFEIAHHSHNMDTIHSNFTTLDPALAAIEAKSRFNVETKCAICLKKGINFPKCPKCQLEFCSRACRVSMGDGERHECG